MTETTFTVAGKTLTVDELVKLYIDAVIGGCLADIDYFKRVVEVAVDASGHNANLLEAFEDGADFRIAFRKKGKKKWTRIMFEEEALLRDLAADEINSRQGAVMTMLADAMGVDEYSINFGD